MTVRASTFGSRLVTIAALLPLLVACGGLLSDVPQRQLYRTTPSFAARVARLIKR